MKKFDARAYSVSDFLEWSRNNMLDLSPKFQRRSVWTRAAKSFLIDTILRGKPMPKVLLTQQLSGEKNIRTVVDGQQRIRTIIEFASGAFTVLKSHNQDHYGKTFSQLDVEDQVAILQYEIGVDMLFNVNLADLLDIFARINTYSVTLNRQEKLNAKYLGVFKTASYELGHIYAGYFLEGGVLTEKQIGRMGEAQLSSDILVSILAGIQTIKNIERFYRKYENADGVPDEIANAKSIFSQSMSFIGTIYPPEDLKNSNWTRPHWFYTLFNCVSHSISPLIGLEDILQPKLSASNIHTWRSALDEVSAKYDEYTEKVSGDIPSDYAAFINFAQRRTTDTDARKSRAKFVLQAISQ